MIKSCRVGLHEKLMNLAGDDLVPDAQIISTHGIEIEATTNQVWPWIVQIGQGRGGFYSYSMLENLIGCNINNANSIHPEWQELDVGDQISIHPRAEKLNVARVNPPTQLVLLQNRPLCWSWSFNLIPIADVSCQLLVRTRVRWDASLSRNLIGPFMKTGHYIMERKMLLGIRQRVQEQK